MKFKIMMFIIFSCGFCISACQEECQEKETRCAGSIVQLCTSDGEWTQVMDCAQVQPGSWQCCEHAVATEGQWEASCLPLDDNCMGMNGDL